MSPAEERETSREQDMILAGISVLIVFACLMAFCGCAGGTMESRPDALKLAECTANASVDAVKVAGAILEAPPDIASRALTGLLTSAPALFRGVVCYSYALATRKASASESDRPDGYLLYNRAQACQPSAGNQGGCARPENKAASILWILGEQRLVRLPASGEG